MTTPETDVRHHTRAAFARGLTDQQRLDALEPLPGFQSKSAMATALLACFDPTEFGILDWKATTA